MSWPTYSEFIIFVTSVSIHGASTMGHKVPRHSGHVTEPDRQTSVSSWRVLSDFRCGDHSTSLNTLNTPELCTLNGWIYGP